ncbi:MAG TPA: hypothetical protein VLH94_04355 [Spirochaetia bacterium]|nr:hypothetical protein [Spirochaetia bacterium]
MKKKTVPKTRKTTAKKQPFHLNATHKIGIGAIVILLTILMITSFIIDSSVNKNCRKAQNKYGGSCVSSLISTVKDKENNSFRERNTAIWTLGRLRNREALPLLLSFYTGIIPEKEPYDKGISQYELKKAILLIDKNIAVSPKIEVCIKEKLADCLPKSDMKSKQICDELLHTINSYSDCVTAGFAILESFPERCLLPDGRSFVNSK